MKDDDAMKTDRNASNSAPEPGVDWREGLEVELLDPPIPEEYYVGMGDCREEKWDEAKANAPGEAGNAYREGWVDYWNQMFGMSAPTGDTDKDVEIPF